ncbi:DUF429 domain-containing protein [Variovorax sp. PAMC 28711]|uniref:DUF429 domain-containing protein n=1 Tax=Variovorax sp. PAMC 28711 TaxID=1795631 RepID=UPI00078C4009|nr:DUF429 domain-containing protein [Variovorax sp. PAMC 28711]AMM23780.1 hypothetical protein AX767_05040 [Variovorax sp. PAMC 28711]
MALLLGCDFSSAPTARKPIVVAIGATDGPRVVLHRLEPFASLQAWSDWLAATPAWVGGFDLPFGLPRELVAQLGWPLAWPALMAHYASLSRAEIRETFAAFCAARPVGGKFAHRAADGPARASPSMKWVNPPVAFMLHAGVPRLIAAGAAFPGLHMPPGAPSKKIALEAYPGLLAREMIGRRSYKSDDRRKQTAERLAARVDLVAALEAGATRLGLALALNADQRRHLIEDASGDRVDAVLCLVQAAWAAARADSPGAGYGLPAAIDPLEGWIVTA